MYITNIEVGKKKQTPNDYEFLQKILWPGEGPYYTQSVQNY